MADRIYLEEGSHIDSLLMLSFSGGEVNAIAGITLMDKNSGGFDFCLYVVMVTTRGIHDAVER
jgi:hypothetical protein